MGLNNPLPSSMASECKKCAKILSSFISPRQAFGPDKVIPQSILANAKGLAIITVLKAGFIGSGRFGSGLIVARLPDGSWSAPSAIATLGGGVGGQIGFELTDFVFILNDNAAVKTFAQAGSVTLGGNVSLAAGPVGRNAEAAGAASLRSVSGIFSYSKTKGLFAGVSLEGSAIIERRDANEKLYGTRYTAEQLLTGSVQPPHQAAPLMTILNSRVFSGTRNLNADDMYNDIPVYDEHRDDVVWEGRQGNASGEGTSSRSRGSTLGSASSRSNTNTWRDDVYDQQQNNNIGAGFQNKKPAPGRPTAPKPAFAAAANPRAKPEAVAIYNFDPDQPGDLGFKKGDIITIVKKTDSENDWWTGRIGLREGVFPSNYVRMKV